MMALKQLPTKKFDSYLLAEAKKCLLNDKALLETARLTFHAPHGSEVFSSCG